MLASHTIAEQMDAVAVDVLNADQAREVLSGSNGVVPHH